MSSRARSINDKREDAIQSILSDFGAGMPFDHRVQTQTMHQLFPHQAQPCGKSALHSQLAGANSRTGDPVHATPFLSRYPRTTSRRALNRFQQRIFCTTFVLAFHFSNNREFLGDLASPYISIPRPHSYSHHSTHPDRIPLTPRMLAFSLAWHTACVETSTTMSDADRGAGAKQIVQNSSLILVYHKRGSRHEELAEQDGVNKTSNI